MTEETEAVRTVAGLMILPARSAPKARGVDEIKTRIVTGMELTQLGDAMISYGDRNKIQFSSGMGNVWP